MSEVAWICWSAALCVLVIGLTVAAVVWAPRHEHDWKVTKYATVSIYVGPHGKDDLPARFVTDISMMCRDCGEPRLKKVDGRWAADVNPKKGATR